MNMGAMHGEPRPTGLPSNWLSEEVKAEIRALWSLGAPDFNGAAAVAAQHACKVFEQYQIPCGTDRQTLLGVAAGRLAEQSRGLGSEAFISSFERVCMRNICTTAVYNSIK